MAHIPFAGVVTTNYDKLLERAWRLERSGEPKVLTHLDAHALGKLLLAVTTSCSKPTAHRSSQEHRADGQGLPGGHPQQLRVRVRLGHLADASDPVVGFRSTIRISGCYSSGRCVALRAWCRRARADDEHRSNRGGRALSNVRRAGDSL